jgi:4-amino-4-deoxy-L-arabinose transferase-like glycosyltransferase
LLAAIIVFAIALRVAAIFVLNRPLESDALSYFTMAKTLAERGVIIDNFGQHAFYSAGYPLLLTPFFMMFGSSVGVALAVNMALTAVSIWLVFRLGVALSGNFEAGLLAAAVFALWFPGVWNAGVVAKENFSTPLLLGLTLCAVAIARVGNARRWALMAGLIWGAALITGGSALLLCAGVGMALILLWRKLVRARFAPVAGAAIWFILGAAIVLTPWLYATDRMVGRPMLTTNAAFNLYLGNNPAATGRFVSIADTAMGADWEATRERLGEVGNADRLQAAAVAWVKDNPERAGALAVRKLGYFWEPNVPDAADFTASGTVAAIRVVEVLQYLVIVVAGVLAFRSRLVARDGKWVIAAMIVGFWAIHASAYVIARYRDPVIPLLIVMASVPMAAWLRKRVVRGA